MKTGVKDGHKERGGFGEFQQGIYLPLVLQFELVNTVLCTTDKTKYCFCMVNKSQKKRKHW